MRLFVWEQSGNRGQVLDELTVLDDILNYNHDKRYKKQPSAVVVLIYDRRRDQLLKPDDRHFLRPRWWEIRDVSSEAWEDRSNPDPEKRAWNPIQRAVRRHLV